MKAKRERGRPAMLNMRCAFGQSAAGMPAAACAKGGRAGLLPTRAWRAPTRSMVGCSRHRFAMSISNNPFISHITGTHLDDPRPKQRPCDPALVALGAALRLRYSLASIKRLPLGIIRNRHRKAMPTTPRAGRAGHTKQSTAPPGLEGGMVNLENEISMRSKHRTHSTTMVVLQNTGEHS